VNLKTMFPKGSKSFFDANSATLTRPAEENALAGQAGGKKRGSMNKTEREFSMILLARVKHGEIKSSKFEQVKVRIGEGCWYVPDFFVERHDKKPLFIEIKGFMRDDARVKFLAAKEQHQWADWEMWRKVKSQWEQIL
jgi:hypothetical protein